jgi:hypothetical protein
MAQLAPMLPSPRNSPARLHPALTQRVNSALARGSASECAA